jgi:hypothetical protein
MSAAFTASTPTLAKLSQPSRAQLKQGRRAHAAVVSSGGVHNKKTSDNTNIAASLRRAGIALGGAAVSLAVSAPAHAMAGLPDLFDNPAVVRLTAGGGGGLTFFSFCPTTFCQKD